MSRPVVIVGAGVIGVCAAYELSKRGVPTLVLDRGEIAGAASAGNAGQMAVGHLPIPRPGLPFMLLKSLLDPTRAVYMRPRLTPARMRWLLGAARASGSAAFRDAMRPLTDLSRLSALMYREYVEAENLDCDFQQTGLLEVYRERDGFDRGKHVADLLKGCDVDVEQWGPDDVAECEPALKPGMVGGFFVRASVSADPARFVKELARRACDQGAAFRTSVNVEDLIRENGSIRGVRTSDGETIDAETVVLAAGVWSDALARTAGVRVPMQPAKGYHVDLPRPSLMPRTPMVLADRLIAVTPFHDRLRLAGTLEFFSPGLQVNRRRLEQLPRGAQSYLREVPQGERLSEWVGLRPCTADGLPVIDWAPTTDNLFIATGHAMMGQALGPITGRLVAQSICGESAEIDPAPFTARRF